MIRLQEVNCTPRFDNFQGDRKAAADTACEEFVMETVWALYVLSLIINQQNHTVLSFPVLDNTLKQFDVKQSPFQVLTLLKSVKAKVDDELAKLVLATVLDHHNGSGSGCNLIRCEIEDPGSS
jgi:hypothetical protein